jgi:hypothetical protein
MLKLAYDYKDQLNKKFHETAFVAKYKFYGFDSCEEYEKDIKSNSWDSLQFVSFDNGFIIGYMSAAIDRPTYSISSLRLINFTDGNSLFLEKDNIIFSLDMKQFFVDLFSKFNFNKINWRVAIGNPAEQIYDKLIQKHGGRVVGVFKDDVKLWDGKLYDVKHYEIMREEFRY